MVVARNRRHVIPRGSTVPQKYMLEGILRELDAVTMTVVAVGREPREFQTLISQPEVGIDSLRNQVPNEDKGIFLKI